jgi:hypothetical protein
MRRFLACGAFIQVYGLPEALPRCKASPVSREDRAMFHMKRIGLLAMALVLLAARGSPME